MLFRTSANLIKQAAKSKLSLNTPKCLHTSYYLYNSDQASGESPKKPETEQNPNQTAANEASNELNQLKEKLTKLQSDFDDCQDKYKRALAEAENVRVRMRKQVDEAKIFGIQGFSKDLLEVADTLNLAIANTNPNKNPENFDANDEKSKRHKEQLLAMYNGLVLTETCLLKIFERHGLVQIKPNEGEKFDPNLHEAIFRVPIPNKESGTLEVVTKIGFKLKDRVIRAAQVGVVQ